MVFPQGFHAFDDLHRLSGIGDGDAQILRHRVSCLQQLGMPVLVNDAHLVQPEEFQVGILGCAEGRADAEQVDYPGFPDQLHTAADDLDIHQRLGILQSDNIPVGHFFDNLLQGISAGNGALLVDLCLGPNCQLRRDCPAKIPVAGKANMAAQTHNGGGRRKRFLRQIVNAQLGNQLRLFQNLGSHGFLRGAEGGHIFLQPKQGTCHGNASFSFVENVQELVSFLKLFHELCYIRLKKSKW